MSERYSQAIWHAMLTEDAKQLLENALEESRLLNQLPPQPSHYVKQSGLDPLKEIRAIIYARIDLLRLERSEIIEKYE